MNFTYLNHGLAGSRRIPQDVIPRHANDPLDDLFPGLHDAVETHNVPDAHLLAPAVGLVDQHPVAGDLEGGQHRGAAGAVDGEGVLGGDVGHEGDFEAGGHQAQGVAGVVLHEAGEGFGEWHGILFAGLMSLLC